MEVGKKANSVTGYIYFKIAEDLSKSLNKAIETWRVDWKSVVVVDIQIFHAEDPNSRMKSAIYTINFEGYKHA